MERKLKRLRRWPKGTWMKIKSAAILIAHMDEKGFTGARLGRLAGCSRAFVSQLRNATKTTCTPQLAERLAEALDIPVDVLFVPNVPHDTRRNGKREVAA